MRPAITPVNELYEVIATDVLFDPVYYRQPSEVDC